MHIEWRLELGTGNGLITFGTLTNTALFGSMPLAVRDSSLYQRDGVWSKRCPAPGEAHQKAVAKAQDGQQ